MDQAELSAWTSEVESLYERDFGDLTFLEDRQGVLVVPTTDQAWSFLRFELPHKQFLHLHSVDIRDAGGARIPRSDVGVAASSHYGSSLKLLRAGRLLNPSHDYHVAFHTLNDQSPWLQLSFVAPIRLGTLALRNRKINGAARATGLVVRASTDGYSWVTLYDGGARLDDFRQKARKLGAKNLFAGDEIPVREMIIDVTACQYEHARKSFVSPEFPARLHEPTQRVLSEIILKRRELEWTSHGARRSFRFWGEPEKAAYIKLAVDLVHDLRGLSQDVCLGFGSVLSIVRDHDLMPHDDDLDIIIGFPKERVSTLSEARRITKDHLEKLGYQVVGKFFCHWHVKRKGRKVDVFVGLYEADNRIGWFPGKRCALKREEVFPATNSELLGVDCPIPRDPERYLEVVYGPDWRSPDPGWEHDWDRSSYVDIA